MFIILFLKLSTIFKGTLHKKPARTIKSIFDFISFLKNSGDLKMVLSMIMAFTFSFSALFKTGAVLLLQIKNDDVSTI